MLYTIFQIIAFQALFLLVYDLFLKRETFFNYNRAYLLLTALLSLVLPFLKFPKLKTITTKDMVINLPEVFIGTKTPTAYEIAVAEQAGIIMEQPQTPLWQIMVFIGIAVSTLIFIFKIAKLFKLKHQNPKRWQGNVLIVKLIKSSVAFSFFNTIFLGERIPEMEKPIIYKHELVHIKELHTLDLLFFEVLRIVFWFNPLVYIYQNRIKELHEYIADSKAVKQNGKVDYYQSLLNQVFDVNNVSFTNTFFKKSLIKKRIAMLQKSKSKRLNLIKYGLLIPMILGMLIYSSTEVRAQQKTESKNEINQELTDEELVKAYYDTFVKMKNNGSAFLEIHEYAGFTRFSLNKYLPTKEEFLKSKAYMQYMADGIIERKSENGTLTQKDIEATDLMRFGKFTSYEDFKAWKSTDEAKDLWEGSTRNSSLRFVVNDLNNFTVDEQKEYDGLKKLLITDPDFDKLAVTDGITTRIIKSSDSMFPINTKSIDVVEVIEVPFTLVDEAPTVFECEDETNNEVRKNCMNQFVNKHIVKNFNTKLADSLNPGKKRIFVQFKIDTEGKIRGVKARGPSEVLEEEAKRVIKTLPQFVPGKQSGELVTVPYSMPIVFQVGDNTAKQMTETYDKLVAQRDRVLKNSNEKNPVVTNLNKQITALKKEIFVKDEINNISRYLREEIDKTEATQNDSTTANRTKIYKAFINQIQNDSIDKEKLAFNKVEVAPVHPNCISISEDLKRKKCTSNAINILVNKNFNTDLAHELGLRGRNKVFVSFNINKQGEVNMIKASAERPKLEEEAKRVIKLLPQFTPGRHNGKLADVSFSLPIVFQVSSPKKD